MCHQPEEALAVVILATFPGRYQLLYSALRYVTYDKNTPRGSYLSATCLHRASQGFCPSPSTSIELTWFAWLAVWKIFWKSRKHPTLVLCPLATPGSNVVVCGVVDLSALPCFAGVSSSLRVYPGLMAKTARSPSVDFVEAFLPRARCVSRNGTGRFLR